MRRHRTAAVRLDRANKSQILALRCSRLRACYLISSGLKIDKARYCSRLAGKVFFTCGEEGSRKMRGVKRRTYMLRQHSQKCRLQLLTNREPNRGKSVTVGLCNRAENFKDELHQPGKGHTASLFMLFDGPDKHGALRLTRGWEQHSADGV